MAATHVDMPGAESFSFYVDLNRRTSPHIYGHTFVSVQILNHGQEKLDHCDWLKEAPGLGEDGSPAQNQQNGRRIVLGTQQWWL